MASQPTALDSSLESVEIPSFIRGCHAYQEIWKLTLGEVLLLQREPANSQDRHMVAVVKIEQIVGHVPACFSVLFSQFLARTCSKATAAVTGGRVNHANRYRLEIPCKYCLYEPKPYLDHQSESLLNRISSTRIYHRSSTQSTHSLAIE